MNKKAIPLLKLNQGLLIWLLLFCSVASVPCKAFASGREISEIFIEASGNNKFEAKIKAHELGMRRSLLLIADQLGIKKEDIKDIPFSVLKKVFTPVMVSYEMSTVEKYNATVTYSYELGHVYSTLLEYGDQKINDLFYEYLVFPVFKQKKFLNIWDDNKNWNDYWISSRNLLDHHKIYYPQKTPYLVSKITGANIFDLKYEDFIDVFPSLLFKKVMIITGEFFTNRRTRESLLQIKKIILSHDTAEALVIEEEYPLRNLDDVPYTVDLAIDKVINNFGALRQNELADKDDEADIVKEEKAPPIIMNFDVFDQEEMDLVTAKLKNVKEIDDFKIEHDYNTKYKILIYTTASEYELAEGLYLNGLSYKIHGNLYNLIDVKKGS
jgi:hypothetical protein